MVKKIFAQTYLWVLLLLLYSPIVIIVIYSFTEAKVLGNWTGFSTKLYSSHCCHRHLQLKSTLAQGDWFCE